MAPAIDYVYRGRKFSVKVGEVHLPDGRRAIKEIVEYRGAVAILAFKGENIILVRQYRPAVNAWLLEVPAGTLEPGEDPRECAIRELEEETGYVPYKLRRLFTMYTSPGYSTETLHVYLAEKLKRTAQRLNHGELLEVVELPLEKAVDMVLDGKIIDGKTIAALLFYTFKHSLPNSNSRA